MPRKSISTRLRFDIFKRDGFKCRYCGMGAPFVALHVDHVRPVALGGTNEPENLRTSCQPCNLGKAAGFLHTDHVAEAERARLAAARAVDEWFMPIDRAAVELEAHICERLGWPSVGSAHSFIIRACVQEFGSDFVWEQIGRLIDIHAEESPEEFNQILNELPLTCQEAFDEDGGE